MGVPPFSANDPAGIVFEFVGVLPVQLATVSVKVVTYAGTSPGAYFPLHGPTSVPVDVPM